MDMGPRPTMGFPFVSLQSNLEKGAKKETPVSTHTLPCALTQNQGGGVRLAIPKYCLIEPPSGQRHSGKRAAASWEAHSRISLPLYSLKVGNQRNHHLKTNSTMAVCLQKW